MGFPSGSYGKEFACNVGDLGLIPGMLGRCPRRGHGKLLQYSCLEDPHGQKSLVGCSPWGLKQLGMTERLTTYLLPYDGSIPPTKRQRVSDLNIRS